MRKDIDTITNYIKKLIFKKKIPKNYLSLNLSKFDKFDSLAIFKMILKIETKYKIKISDNDLFSNKFRNIKNISTFLYKKINKK